METTEDAVFDGAVTLFQPKTGFRAGTDSLLLAAGLDARTTGKVLEVGCGAGGALFPSAWRLRSAQFTGLERDTSMAALARRGVEANGVSGRVEIVEGDAAAIPPDWENRFDLVFSNPPFFEAGSTTPPGEGKGGAYLESLSIDGWVKAMLFAAKPKAPVVLIHRAAALTEILGALDRRSGEITVLPVRPHPGAEAKRVLVRARKGLRRGPTRLLAGIALFEARGGRQTDAAMAVAIRGQALDWA